MRQAATFGLALLLACAPLAAHETYFAPPPVARIGAPLALQLSSGMGFPALGTGPAASRVARAEALTGSTAVKVSVGQADARALNLSLVPPAAGLLMVAVDLAPMPITLDAAKVAEYFAEVEPDAAVRAAYAALPAPRRWQESYAKHAKLLVCVAPCSDARAATTPAGQKLEFVARDAGLRQFVLLENGKPRAGQLVELIGGGKTLRLRTDAAGMVEVPAARRGDLLLATTVLRAPVQPGAPFTSDFATLVLRQP